MTFDDFLFAIILAGVGICGAYLRAELLLHRQTTELLRKEDLLQRELHAKRGELVQK